MSLITDRERDLLAKIAELEHELKKRPKAVVVDTRQNVTPFTVDQFPVLIKGGNTYKIIIEDEWYKWEFHAAVSTSTPDESVTFETLYANGRETLVPISIENKCQPS